MKKKTNKREKDCSALTLYDIRSLENYNLNLQFCDTYANQSCMSCDLVFYVSRQITNCIKQVLHCHVFGSFENTTHLV